jgi:hypothetical protein
MVWVNIGNLLAFLKGRVETGISFQSPPETSSGVLECDSAAAAVREGWEEMDQRLREGEPWPATYC